MAASPNPLQGSLFHSEERSPDINSQENQSSNLSSERLANQELKDDASLRPRSKKTKRNENQINNLNELSIPEIEEPKWSHHSLPNIDDLTPALKHYVQLKIELISREESASPASGSYKRYNERQETIINRVFNI